MFVDIASWSRNFNDSLALLWIAQCVDGTQPRAKDLFNNLPSVSTTLFVVPAEFPWPVVTSTVFQSRLKQYSRFIKQRSVFVHTQNENFVVEQQKDSVAQCANDWRKAAEVGGQFFFVTLSNQSYHYT